MQAAISVLWRRLKVLESIRRDNKAEARKALPGSQLETDIIRDIGVLNRECDDIERALKLLTAAGDQAGTRRRIMEETRRDHPH